MASLPLLPGYQFNQTSRKKFFPRQQTLAWNKGVPIYTTQTSALKDEDFLQEEIKRKELHLQFGDRRHVEPSSRFLPKWVILEKKVLQFLGYFTEFISDPRDVYQVRTVRIFYYLIDDTISIIEPKKQNSGLTQGTLLKRQRVPRSYSAGKSATLEGKGHEREQFWHWSDLNRGIEMEVYGRKYVLCDCDEFTKEFLLSEGTDLNPPIEVPLDPHESLRLQRRETPNRSSFTRPATSRISHLRPLNDTILTFDIMLEEEVENKRSRAASAVLSYRLEDGKVEIRKPVSYEDMEIKRFSPVVLKWTRIPLSQDFKTSVADIGEEDEASDFGPYLTPEHLIPPAQIQIFGRKALVTGCDSAAAKFLKESYGVEDVPQIRTENSEMVTESGSSGRTKSDIISKPIVRPGLMENIDSTVLRFLAKLKCRQKEEETRTFIISYYTVDSTFEIYEKVQPGGVGGKILSRNSIPKPKMRQPSSGTMDKLQNYSLEDISIGSEMDVFGRLFQFTGADRYVLAYAESHPEKVTPALLDSLHHYFKEKDSR